MFISLLVSVWSDDWWRGLPAADPDRHREDHEHQAGTRPQNLQRHSHVQKHRRGTEVTLPHSPGAIILCQNHSFAGKKKKKEKPWALFSYVWCPVPIREREKERGDKTKELGQRDILLSNRRMWKSAGPDWYGSWMERWKSTCFYRVWWFFKQMLWYLIAGKDLKIPLSTRIRPPASCFREWHYWRWWCWTMKQNPPSGFKP